MDEYNHYKPITILLYRIFSSYLADTPGKYSASFIVRQVSTFSATIPPYVTEYENRYTNDNVVRVDMLNNYDDILDIDWQTYLNFTQKSVVLTSREELQKRKFAYKLAFENLSVEDLRKNWQM